MHPFPGRKRLPVQLRLPLLPEPVRAQRQPSPRQQAAMSVRRARRRCLRAVRRRLPHRRRRQPQARPLRRPPVQPRRCPGRLQRCDRVRKASGRHLCRHRPVRRRQAPPRGSFSPEKQRPDRHGPLRRQVRGRVGRTRQFNSHHRDRRPDRLPLLEIQRRRLRAARPRLPRKRGRYLPPRCPVPSLRKRRRAGLWSVRRFRYRKGPCRPRQLPRQTPRQTPKQQSRQQSRHLAKHLGRHQPRHRFQRPALCPPDKAARRRMPQDLRSVLLRARQVQRRSRRRPQLRGAGDCRKRETACALRNTSLTRHRDRDPRCSREGLRT